MNFLHLTASGYPLVSFKSLFYKENTDGKRGFCFPFRN